jgi:hypothetical protein
MGAQGDTARPVSTVRTITERFEADLSDKALVAELVHRLGFDPAAVSELHITVPQQTLLIEVTRRAGSKGRG